MLETPRRYGGYGSQFLHTAPWMGIFAFFVFLYIVPAASAQTLIINGSTGGSFPVGASWTLNLSGAPANQDVTVCAIDPDGGSSCTLAVNMGLPAQTTASGAWTASGSFSADAVGTWQEWVTVGAATSNTVTFTVTALLNFSIAGGGFRVGNAWTLLLASNLPNKDVWICAIVNNGPQTCTPGPLLPNPGLATTNGSGGWNTNGTFVPADIGNWREWARVFITPTRFVESNQITFTVTACTPETNGQFCQRLGKNCGTVSGADNCVVARMVADCSFGAGCPVGQTCGGGGVPNVCGGISCTPETNSQFCSRLGKNCGTVSGADNCVVARTVADCSFGAGCSTGQTCGGGGTPNVCGVSATPIPTSTPTPTPTPTPIPTPTPSAGGLPPAPPFDSGIYDLTKHNPLSSLSFLRLFCTAANWLVTIGLILVVLMIAIAGIRMLTSRGDEAKLRSGKATLTGAIIGLLVLLFAKAIILIILNFLGLPLTAMTC